MKKMYLTIVTAIAISSLISSQALAIVSVLRNNYGASVEFIEIAPSMATNENYARYIKKIDNGKTAHLTDFFNRGELSLRTVNGRFQDVSGIVDRVDAEKNQHPNETPVITINYSLNPVYWSLTLSWELK